MAGHFIGFLKHKLFPRGVAAVLYLCTLRPLLSSFPASLFELSDVTASPLSPEHVW